MPGASGDVVAFGVVAEEGEPVLWSEDEKVEDEADEDEANKGQEDDVGVSPGVGRRLVACTGSICVPDRPEKVLLVGQSRLEDDHPSLVPDDGSQIKEDDAWSGRGGRERCAEVVWDASHCIGDGSKDVCQSGLELHGKGRVKGRVGCGCIVHLGQQRRSKGKGELWVGQERSVGRGVEEECVLDGVDSVGLDRGRGGREVGRRDVREEQREEAGDGPRVSRVVGKYGCGCVDAAPVDEGGWGEGRDSTVHCAVVCVVRP